MFLGTSAAFVHRSGIVSVILDPFSVEIKFSAPFSAQQLQNNLKTPRGSRNVGIPPLQEYLTHLGLERHLAVGNLDNDNIKKTTRDEKH